MRYILLFTLCVITLGFSAPAFAQNDGIMDGKRRGKMMERMKNMPSEQRRAMVERFVESGKMPMLTKLWPSLSEDQKNDFINASSQDERRALMQDVMQSFSPQQRQEMMQAMQGRRGAGGRGGSEPGFGGQNSMGMMGGMDSEDLTKRRGTAFGGNSDFPSMDEE